MSASARQITAARHYPRESEKLQSKGIGKPGPLRFELEKIKAQRGNAASP